MYADFRPRAQFATASGKSTLACALELELLQRKKRAFRLDGDNVRFGLNKDLGFSPKDREENIRRVGEVSSRSSLTRLSSRCRDRPPPPSELFSPQSTPACSRLHRLRLEGGKN